MSEPKMTRTIEEAVDQIQPYVAKYDKQQLYKDFDARTYLNDMLYGIGISMSPEYQAADGFNEFKKDLIEFLKQGVH